MAPARARAARVVEARMSFDYLGMLVRVCDVWKIFEGNVGVSSLKRIFPSWP